LAAPLTHERPTDRLDARLALVAAFRDGGRAAITRSAGVP
jgi:hypothetical protein